MDRLSNWMAVPRQTWIAANTFSDLLIASAMIYHVSASQLLSTGSLEVDAYPTAEKDLGRQTQR